jgi:DNA mismatch repair ATPase MutS
MLFYCFLGTVTHHSPFYQDAHFTYSHRIRPGVNRSSHGLKVARMAGIPETAMGVATTTFHWLHAHAGLTCSEQGELRGLGVQLAPSPETSLHPSK